MKKLLLCLFYFGIVMTCFAQADADRLIKEGIALHDEGKYKEAIKKYDEALQLEPENYKAAYEKSLSLVNMKEFDAAEVIARKILEETKDPEYRRLTYVNYGTLLDYKGEGMEAVNMYNIGIKEFPDSYLLYFNKGITQVGMKDEPGAIESFKMSVQRNPRHASSHNALGRLVSTTNRIPAILSMVCFLIIEPKGKRADDNRKFLDQLMMRGIEKTGDNNVNITIDASLLDKKNKKKEDDFSSAEMVVSLMFSNNAIADTLGVKTAADKLSYQLQMLINLIDEKGKDKGFFKNFYIPFFTSLKKNELVTIASYIILASSNDPSINNWIKENKDDIDGFYRWWENYEWPRF